MSCPGANGLHLTLWGERQRGQLPQSLEIQKHLELLAAALGPLSHCWDPEDSLGEPSPSPALSGEGEQDPAPQQGPARLLALVLLLVLHSQALVLRLDHEQTMWRLGLSRAAPPPAFSKGPLSCSQTPGREFPR